jgi:hypothetical protein
MDNDDGDLRDLPANSDLAYLKTAPFAAAVFAGPDFRVVMANTRHLAIWQQDELTLLSKQPVA